MIPSYLAAAARGIVAACGSQAAVRVVCNACDLHVCVLRCVMSWGVCAGRAGAYSASAGFGGVQPEGGGVDTWPRCIRQTRKPHWRPGTQQACRQPAAPQQPRGRAAAPSQHLLGGHRVRHAHWTGRVGARSPDKRQQCSAHRSIRIHQLPAGLYCKPLGIIITPARCHSSSSSTHTGTGTCTSIGLDREGECCGR